MQLTVFASGSSGNCSLFQGGGRRVLLDAGISARRIKTALAGEGLTPDGLDGIFITHEHSDHIAGLAVLLKQFPVPVFAPGTVAESLRRSIPGASAYVRDIPLEYPIDLDGLTVTAFPTPHDAPSAGYRLEADGQTAALATDTGCVTDVMLDYLSGAQTVLIEANHDEAMLRCGPYPAYLKRRILSDRGHLSNAECTWLASVLAHRGAERIVLGHLSRQNNLPALAKKTVSRGLENTAAQLFVAPELGRLEVDGTPCCI
ncbi:MAG: MBL fold metallo-hydrolase [Oscillospiraceae bacterium]|nr:MBL fold metallo-hydrolase [Oscillospiraceae bacterium]